MNVSELRDHWDDVPSAVELASDADFPRRCAEYIRHKVRGLPFSTDESLVPIRPVILPAPARTALNSAARYLADLIHRVCWSLTDDPATLARLVGLHPDQVPLLGLGGAQYEIDYSGCNARPDAMLVDGQPVFLECNFGAANSSPVTSHYLLAAYRELYGLQPCRGPAEVAEPFEGRAALYQRICTELDRPHSVAIVGTMREPDIDDIRYFEAEARYLRTQGFDSAFVEPDFFDQHDPGAPRYSVALKHLVPGEWHRAGMSFDGMGRAHASTVFVVPDSGLALSSKLIFAWLSAESVPLSAADRDFVHRHIPWSRRVEPGQVLYEDRPWNLVDLATRRQGEFVLKPLNSCGGRGVLLGRHADSGEWRSRLQRAAHLRDHVLQRYVEADRLSMDFFDDKAGKVSRVAVSYVLGPYTVDGISAGCSIRHIPGGSSQVVNHAGGAALNIAI